jgi:glutaminase
VDAHSDETAQVQRVLDDAIAIARSCDDGAPATYIPELANVDSDLTSAAITLADGRMIRAGDWPKHRFTLQSSAKVALLAALLEDQGEDEVFRVVGKEPSGGGFAGIARLETHGPMPANPLVNAGAIALCGLLEGNLEDRLGRLESWVERLHGVRLPVSARVLASERRTGDRNRALAYLLRSTDVLRGDVDDTLEVYFTLCSYESDVQAVSRLGAVLATGGLAPGTGERLLSPRSASLVVALMATCGMYDESGAHLAETGLPAKSGVSGVILAVAPGRAGIAVASPRINHKGGSVRGHLILRRVAEDLGWHLARRGP